MQDKPSSMSLVEEGGVEEAPTAEASAKPKRRYTKRTVTAAAEDIRSENNQV